MKKRIGTTRTMLFFLALGLLSACASPTPEPTPTLPPHRNKYPNARTNRYTDGNTDPIDHSYPDGNPLAYAKRDGRPGTIEHHGG